MGRYVLGSLIAQGHDIVLLAREEHIKIPKCKVVHGLLHEFDYSIARGCDWVVHMAGLVDMSKSESDMFYQNVEGTKAVLERCASAGVPNFLYMGSISVYGKRDNPHITEDTLPRPDTPYARSKYQAELLTHNYPGNVCILRPAMVFGEGFDEGFRMAHKMISRNQLPLIGNGGNHIPLVHAEDVAGAVCAAINTNAAGVYNVCNAELMTQRELYTFVANEVGAKTNFISIPRPLAGAALGAFNIVRVIQHKKPVPYEFVEMLATERGVDASKMVRKLGYMPGKLRPQLKEFVAYLSSKSEGTPN